jgi:hypothetical protein
LLSARDKTFSYTRDERLDRCIKIAIDDPGRRDDTSLKNRGLIGIDACATGGNDISILIREPGLVV